MSSVRAWPITLAWAVLASCGPAKRDQAAPVRNLSLSAPPDSLYMPPLSGREFTPPAIRADDVASLREALLDVEAVEVALDPGLEIGRPELQRLVGRHVPLGEIRTVSLAERLEDPPDDPKREAATIKSAPPSTELLIGRAAFTAQAWSQQPSQTVGSCEGVLRDLGQGQEASLAELEPFLDWLDAELWTRYERELADARSKVPSEVSGSESCMNLYGEVLAGYDACTDPGSCRTTPRVMLGEQLVLAAPLPDFSVPEGCAGAQQLEPLEAAAARAVGQTLPSIDPGWSELADRMAALTAVHDALEDACAPRRRHLDPESLESASRLLGRVEDGLNRSEPAREGRGWERVAGKTKTVPGLGRVSVLAQFGSGSGSAAQRIRLAARGLRTVLIDGARCVADHPLPLMVVLTHAGASRTSYLGYHYRESLFCPGLDPL